MVLHQVSATALSETSKVLSSPIVLTRVTSRGFYKADRQSRNTIPPATWDSSCPPVEPRFLVVQEFIAKSWEEKKSSRTFF